MSESKLSLLLEVESFLHVSLNTKDDLQKIYSICVELNIEKKFEELSFTGKYLNGLLKVLKSGVNLPEVESLDHVKKDLSANMEKLISQIRVVLSHSDENTQTYFENKYFQLSQQNLLHLNLLIQDLDRVKKYLNYQKRKQ